MLKLLKSTSNLFWKDVLESCKFVTKGIFEKTSLTPTEVLSVPVWFNSYITVNRKSIFIKELYDKGVQTIDDFSDNNGIFYTREKFVEKYNIPFICFMKYNSIICAISIFLKGTQFSREGFVRLQRPYIPMMYRILILNNKCTKPIYRLINSEKVNPTVF